MIILCLQTILLSLVLQEKSTKGIKNYIYIYISWQFVTVYFLFFEGLIWLVDSFGQMFCFVPSSSKRLNLISVDPPEPQQTCRSFSASVGLAWCLLNNGHVYIRRQMAGHCLPGYGWDKVDMAQIGQPLAVMLCTITVALCLARVLFILFD